ncbi:MAG: hypothetical protein H6945_16950 [Zoogloeaceae bacterium]|nr:hypothetical protein [Rhodocyclaceae bacterium]MCP5237428.1 hypothetical protein [Zoogloeaceae bacterium]
MFQALMKLAESSTQQLREAGEKRSQAADGGALPHPAWLPMQHASAFHELLGRAAQRQFQIQQATLTAMLSPRPDFSLIAETIQMQQAALARIATVQTESIRKIAELTAGATGIRKANTLSKLVDQEYDLVSGFGAILAEQTTAMVELLESLQIGYGYLVAQRLGD